MDVSRDHISKPPHISRSPVSMCCYACVVFRQGQWWKRCSVQVSRCEKCGDKHNTRFGNIFRHFHNTNQHKSHEALSHPPCGDGEYVESAR
jgi:Zn ribbon nucleic-acid-binding protein